MARRLPDVLTRAEAERLVAAPSRYYPTGQRDRCVIKLMLNSGLRSSEVLSLTWRDIDLQTGKLTVRQGKGNKDRQLWVAEATLELVRQWRDIAPDSAYCFPTLSGNRQYDVALRQMVKRRAAKVGIEKDVHPHMLRHTHATELYRETKDIRLVQKVLGHASLATTMIYTHLVDDDMQAAMRGFDL